MPYSSTLYRSKHAGVAPNVTISQFFSRIHVKNPVKRSHLSRRVRYILHMAFSLSWADLHCTCYISACAIFFLFYNIFFSVKKKIHEKCYFVVVSFYNGAIWLNFLKPNFQQALTVFSYSYFWRVEIRGLCQDSERILRNWGIWSNIKRQCLM